MDIISPTLPVYQFEKMKNPNFTYQIRKVPKGDFEFVEHIEKITRGATVIRTEMHWEAVRTIFDFLYRKYPQEFIEFKQAVGTIRRTRGKGGKNKTGEIMYVGAIPPRLHNVIRKCFPEQEFNKAFVWKLVRKLPILKVAGEGN
jgi:hypothetical protein